MQPSLLFVPGWQDSGPDHWQTHWHARALAQFGPHCAQRVQQRDWLYPTRAEWVETLSQHILQLPHPVILIAHSLGCITAAHLPAAVQAKVVGAWLVAPADVERVGAPSVLTDFAPIPQQSLPYRSLVVASDNDPYAQLSRAQRLAQAWGSEWLELAQAGHINPEAGYGTWESGWSVLLTWIAQSNA